VGPTFVDNVTLAKNIVDLNAGLQEAYKFIDNVW